MYHRSTAHFLLIMVALNIAACDSPQKTPYQDNFPVPCTQLWFDEIEKEIKLIEPGSSNPSAGSAEWLLALDKKYSISQSTDTIVGDLEWCHQVHQRFIGL